ncbi:MAG: glucose 1-dehydrogenase [Peptostreptococcaceae bacterium]
MENLFSLVGKNAIVTGGSRGIGRSYCNYLAKSGANIIVVGTNFEAANIAAQEIKDEYNVKTIAIACNVSNKDDVFSMFEKAEEEFGDIHVVINNAGIAEIESVENMSYESYKKVMDVNLDGVFLCAQAAGKLMLKRKIKGSIINIGSMSAHIINIPQQISVYEASKAAVVHLTKAMAVEWAKYGIRVNSISPGYVLTELVAQMKDMHPIWTEKIPMGRMAKPEEIAPLAVYLASDASSYVTGSDIIIDGGYTCI